MLATSTHDNKRSEDVRARLNVLSEIPDRWQTALRQWSRLNVSKKHKLEGQNEADVVPDKNAEYLFYQTLLGTWPLSPSASTGSEWGALLQPDESEAYQQFRKRITDYTVKAAKEAKLYTSWLNPNESYEEATRRFVERVLLPSQRNRFLREFAPLARLVAYYGHFNSLSQMLLKLTSPGVPDIYQGNELWDFSLVDPDNRRPVDYEQRNKLLRQIVAAERRKSEEKMEYAQALVNEWQDGRIKLFVIQGTLHLRRQHPTLFTGSAYIPLEVTGERAQHICAYLRRNNIGGQFLVLVPRLVATLTELAEQPPIGAALWGDTTILLPPETILRSYSHLFTGERLILDQQEQGLVLPVAKALGNFPLALLTTQ